MTFVKSILLQRDQGKNNLATSMGNFDEKFLIKVTLLTSNRMLFQHQERELLGVRVINPFLIPFFVFLLSANFAISLYVLVIIR